MQEKTVPVVKCPICGQEYHPAEMFIPANFFGKPGEIFKTDSGALDFYTGSDMDLDETYVCDNCGATMKVHAELSFTVEANPVEVTAEEYVSTFTKPTKIKLTEENLFE